MGTYRLGVLQGDGIGAEVVGAAVRTLQAAAKRTGVRFELIDLPMGHNAIQAAGHPLPQHTKEGLARCDGWIMGPHDSASYPPDLQELRNPSGELRRHFELYANFRPVHTYGGVAAIAGDLDIVVVRENTEGFYPDRNMYAGCGEMMPTPDIALSVGVFTTNAAERIARAACQLAVSRRKHVTIVHKANVIRLGNGLFLRTCREVAATFPELRVDDCHVDAAVAHLVRRPAEFDVIVTTNMFGDILSNLAAALAGSLGLAPSLNAGAVHAMAQATHGAAPDIAGRDIANPVAEILSAAMLARWLADRHGDEALSDVATAVEKSVETVFRKGVSTPDLGGSATTRGFTDAIISNL